jgi:exopolysaccharide biosynthesis protein
VWAAPASPALQKIRHHVSGDTVRVVLDMSDAVSYTATQQDEVFSVIIELDKAVTQAPLPPQEINDPAVAAVRVVNPIADKKAQVVIDCRQPVSYKIFTLANPHRIVIDITKLKEKKTEQEIVSGIRYTSWYKTGKAGALNIHILDISPQSGYTLEPMLVRQSVLGIDPLSQVLMRSDVLAAVNASYFAANGDIIGLLKMDDEVISSTSLARTALGINADGKVLIDQVSYQGVAELPDEVKLPLSGVNESRGANGLILYNRFWGPTTKTNSYGLEYAIIAGAVSAIQPGNSTIPANGYVLSAHGETAQKLAGLKIGDPVQTLQTLGPVWDQTVHAVGAGPMLVKQGNVFVTTKLEEFGSDVAGGRAPRTAVGLTQDGRILLVVVDGRQALSKGMSLLELALFLRELGAVNAMNLDGGGSSEMIVKGRIVNKPSDGKERRVGNALAVVPRKLAI